MFTSGLSVFLLLHIVEIQSVEHCVTPNNEQGSCTSLYTCPQLLGLLTKHQEGSEELVRKSRCGSTPTDPLVCCPQELTQNCTTPANKPGKCTPLGLCGELLKLLETQEAGLIEYVRKSRCQITQTDAFVCCPFQSDVKLDIQLQTVQNAPKVQDAQSTDLLIPSRRYCGYQHSDDYSSDSQGTDITDFPWLVGLNYIFKSGKEMVNCQGSVINARYILTAAHCVQRRPQATLKNIRLGEYSIQNSTDCIERFGFTECSEPVQEFGAEKIIMHPDFSQNPRITSDIALIRLNETIEAYSDYIRPICLPLPESHTPQVGDRIYTTGWGRGVNTTKSQTDVKKKVSNTLISNEECSKIYKSLSNNRVYIDDSQLCTVELSDNAEINCFGDSGGPVMFSHKSQWYIEGIHSFGTSKCGNMYPVVHTRISDYIDWIRDNLEPW